MSLSMMPPCIVAWVGFWCFLAMLTPSTMTLSAVGEDAHDLALLADVLAGEHRTWSPFLSFTTAITAPPVRARRSA